jgi:hypothetical protein
VRLYGAASGGSSFPAYTCEAVHTGVRGYFPAALVAAALVAACGGGRAKPSTSPSDGQSSASSSANSVAATTATAARPPSAAYWPYKKLVARLAGRTVVLPRGRLRLDSALLVCNGDGVPLKTTASRRWRRYTCTQTLFKSGVDRDITFDVVISSATQLSITSPRYGPR